MIGKMIWKYRVTEFLGSGGSAKVFKAVDTRDQREVAIKILPEDFEDERLARFKSETRAIRELDHPSIIRILDMGMEGPSAYYVMEYIPGVRTLKELVHERYEIERDGLDLPLILSIAHGLAQALDHIHRRGIFHRDLKPGNVLVTPEGRPVLMDFGLAKIEADPQMTQTGTLVGTPLYMSPEQLQGGPVDHRSDLYQLGVVMYKMITGKVPFEGEQVYTVAARRLTEKIPPPSRYNPLVSSRLERIVLRLTQKEPDARYPSAADLLVDLEALDPSGEPGALEETVSFQQGEPPAPPPMKAGPAGPGSPSPSSPTGRVRVAAGPAADGPSPRLLAAVAGTGLLLGIALTLGVSSLIPAHSIRLRLTRPVVEPRMSAADLSFTTGLGVRSELEYQEAGSDRNRLAVISARPSREHRILLDGLAPDRTYETTLRFVLEDGRLVTHAGPRFRTRTAAPLLQDAGGPGGLTPASVAAAVEALRSSEFTTRLKALEVLEKDPPRSAMADLKRALDDENNEVRLAAHRVLGKLLARGP